MPAGAVAVPLRTWDAFLRAPSRLAIDQATGTVYVADPLNGRVVGRAADGRVVTEISGTGRPASIAVAPGGHLLVGDGDAGRVTRYDASGQPLSVLGLGDGEFGFPNDIDVDPVNGEVFVSDSEAHEVRRYAADGTLLGTIGGFGAGNGQLNVPTGVHLDAAGLHVVDQRNSAIKTFAPDGAFVGFFPTFNVARGFFCGGFSCGRNRVFDQGLWIDPAGRVFVADSFGSQVVTGPASGAVDAVIGTLGDGPGELRTPTDVVVDGCGRLFVASAGNGKVQMFGLGVFQDPELYTPARLHAPGRAVDPDTDARVEVVLEVPSHPVGDIDADSLLGNGVFRPLDVRSGDVDRNGRPDMLLAFGPDFIASLAPGTVTPLTVSGQVQGLQFEAVAEVATVAPAVTDSDGDGVLDGVDACPGTVADDLVDGSGCSPAQLCPCEGPVTGGAWRNHGRYVKCVRQAVHGLRDRQAVDRRQHRRALRQLIRQAGRASCGRPNRDRKREVEDED